MNEYIHKVQYYETDRMGITHHSNYIRWMEEEKGNPISLKRNLPELDEAIKQQMEDAKDC